MKKASWLAIGGEVLVLVVTLTIGLIILLGITPQLIFSLGLGEDMVKTTGTVVGINSWIESGNTYHSPDVLFTTENGQQFIVDMWCPPFGCFSRFDIGLRVPVVYPRKDPQRAIADTLMGRLGTPMLMLLIGLAFTLMGFVSIANLIRDRISRRGVRMNTIKGDSTVPRNAT